MSHDDHAHEQGGHEIDKMPNARLFNLLFGLSALTLLACFGVIQLFNLQVRGVEDERNLRGSFRLMEYQAEQAAHRTSFARVLIADDDGLSVSPAAGKGPVGRGTHNSVVNRMPLEDARALVLKDPKAFRAKRAYRGWKNPDPALADKEGATPAAAARKPAGKAPKKRPPSRAAAAKPGAGPARALPSKRPQPTRAAKPQ
ncbi:MAG: hypothetical protein JKY37_03880 [Nannocystaceae bacterium]|nr:hypothetical protein [Nannocystaceae bacterium]